MDGNNDLFPNYAPESQPVSEPGTSAAGLLLLAAATALKLSPTDEGLKSRHFRPSLAPLNELPRNF
jgi:hypothetical protein